MFETIIEVFGEPVQRLMNPSVACHVYDFTRSVAGVKCSVNVAQMIETPDRFSRIVEVTQLLCVLCEDRRGLRGHQ